MKSSEGREKIGGKHQSGEGKWERSGREGKGEEERRGMGKVRGSVDRVLKYFMFLNAAAETITRHKIRREKKTSFLTVDNYVQKGTCGSRGEWPALLFLLPLIPSFLTVRSFRREGVRLKRGGSILNVYTTSSQPRKCSFFLSSSFLYPILLSLASYVLFGSLFHVSYSSFSSSNPLFLVLRTTRSNSCRSWHISSS